MGLLKKTDKKPFKVVNRGASSAQNSARPRQVPRLAPCILNCPAGNDVRGWMTTISQRDKTGLSEPEALEKAWRMLVETNPFPAVMGRVCPHPCEDNCNREGKDGAVAVNAVERYIGDWAIEQGLGLTKLEDDRKAESIGVIGAGPAGLSFAYQLARRGYPVTVYEKTDKAGGMLYWGIPFYRQPATVLDAEIQRILDLGVELKLSTAVGKDVSGDELRSRHQVIFLGIGAHKGRKLRIPGEDGSGVFAGTDYLRRVNAGEAVDVGARVAVIGGGDTAIDAARAARRAGAEVTIIYRRTRTEMPAIDSEVEDALLEDIAIEYLVAPLAVERGADGRVVAMKAQRMELGEPDSSGRRRPVPIEGSEFTVPVDSVIAAISQDPDWDSMEGFKPGDSKWLQADDLGKVAKGLWAGGDVLNLGLATIAMAQGRWAAEAVHAELRGLEPPRKPQASGMVATERIKLDFYEAKAKAERGKRPVREWLKTPDGEIDQGITHEQFLDELSRCFSCGQCFGCERCWMYCTPGCFSKEESPEPGHYYAIHLEKCDGCGKCAEECPCGFVEMA